MKNYTKISYKNLLIASLTFLTYGQVKADTASIINGGDSTRNLSALHYEIEALGTDSDISGIFNNFNTIVNDITTLGTAPLATATQAATIISSIAPLATASGVTSAVAPLATSAGLTSAVAPLATSAGLTSAVAPLATSAGLTSAVAPLATSAGLRLAVAPLATSAGLISAVAPLATSAELTSAVAPLATSAGLTSAVAPLATSAGLTSAVAPLATSAGLTSAVAPLATSAGLTSAVAPLATSEQATTLISNLATLGTSTDVSGLYAILALIVANLQLDPINQVDSAASNRALTANRKTVTSNDANKDAIAYLATYNKNLGEALTAVAKATTFATQSNANTVLAINAVNAAIESFRILAIQWNKDGAIPSSGYGVADINGALNQLKYALIYLLSQQPIA